MSYSKIFVDYWIYNSFLYLDTTYNGVVVIINHKFLNVIIEPVVMSLHTRHSTDGSHYISYKEVINETAWSNDTEHLLADNDGENSPDEYETGTYHEVFKATGFGKWHILLLLQCGWALASDAIEIMCISFTIDSLHDSMDLLPKELTWLTVVLFLGMMVGGYFWGSLADIWGRRQVVIYSLAINGIFGVSSAFPKSYWLLLVCRFFSGFGAGGSLPVCFSYFSEFQPKEKRGAMISALATFWMAGNVLTAGIAWLLLPSYRHLSIISPYGEQWRLFIIVCSLPSVSSSFFFCCMPESPKYLMEKHKSEAAFLVLKRIHKRNYPSATFPYHRIVESDDVEQSRCDSSVNVQSSQLLLGSPRTWKQAPTLMCSCCGYFFISIGHSIKHQVQTMFGSRQRTTRKASLLLMGVYFSIAFGGYGLTLWLPSLMQKAEQYSGSPCQAHPHNQSHNSSDANVYFDVLIGAAAQLPGNILTLLIIDIVGGKIILVVGMILSGISVLFIYLVKNKTEVILMSAIFNCVSTMVWASLDVVTPEMYETSVRASASGFLTALSRIASVLGTTIFGLYLDSNCNVPILTVSVVLLCGGVLAVFLPKTRQIELR